MKVYIKNFVNLLDLVECDVQWISPRRELFRVMLLDPVLRSFWLNNPRSCLSRNQVFCQADLFRVFLLPKCETHEQDSYRKMQIC